MIVIGTAFDFKNWLQDSNYILTKFESWTDNLCYRFAKKLLSGRVEMLYKYLSQSPRNFGHYHNERVRSFKELARKAESSPNTIVIRSFHGIKRGPTTGPWGAWHHRNTHNFSKAEGANKMSSEGDRC